MMNGTYAHWQESREIVRRIVVTGDLELLTPTHLGNGEPAGPIDMGLLRDILDPTRALLTGASITGALRNYLWEIQRGYEYHLADKGRGAVVTFLFGGERGDDGGAQSLLIVDDALSRKPAQVEIRDGVCIDPRTGTAKVDVERGRRKGYKFDLELLQAGTIFPLRFELLIPRYCQEGGGDKLVQALARALQGFEKGEIALGARKRRGFGTCHVAQWRIVSYDLTTPAGLLGWLAGDDRTAKTGNDIAALLDVDLPGSDARECFTIEAAFHVETSLLIRAQAESGADSGHLRSARPAKGAVPVLSGTSLAGVLRRRALRIANTLVPEGQGDQLVDALFGSSADKDLRASRVSVHESEVTGATRLVQSRVKIDRFTGGAYPAALFSEEPIFGGDLEVKLQVRNPQPHEIGLLLLLLKDLWTGDLPVGGERSVGRGRLTGTRAELVWKKGKQPPVAWKLVQQDGALALEGDSQDLERCVAALRTYPPQEANHDQDS